MPTPSPGSARRSVWKATRYAPQLRHSANASQRHRRIAGEVLAEEENAEMLLNPIARSV